jgi:hypothetical protein
MVCVVFLQVVKEVNQDHYAAGSVQLSVTAGATASGISSGALLQTKTITYSLPQIAAMEVRIAVKSGSGCVTYPGEPGCRYADFTASAAFAMHGM